MATAGEMDETSPGKSVFITQKGKVQHKETVIKDSNAPKPEKWSSGQPVSHSTALLLKKGEVDQEHERFEAKKREIQERRQKCEEREAGLEEKKRQYLEQRVKFEVIMSENDEKRNRSVKKAAEESRAIDQMNTAIAEKKMKLEKYVERKENARRLSERLALGQEYLTAVVGSADLFGSISEILSRYAVLQTSEKMAQDQRKQDKKELDGLRSELTVLQKQIREQEFMLQSKLASYKKQLEQEKDITRELELEIGDDSAMALEKVRHSGEISMTIAHFCSSLRLRKCGDLSPIEQLNLIKDRLSDIQDIALSYGCLPVTQKQADIQN